MPYNTRRAHYDLFSFNHRKNTHTHRQYIYRMVGDFDEGRKKSLKCFMWNNWALHDRFCCCCCFENWFGMICDQGVVEDLRTTKEKQTNDSALKSTMPHTNSAYLYKRCMPREKWIWNGIFICAAFCFAPTQPHTHTCECELLCWCFSMPKQNDETKTLKKINQHIMPRWREKSSQPAN